MYQCVPLFCWKPRQRGYREAATKRLQEQSLRRVEVWNRSKLCGLIFFLFSLSSRRTGIGSEYRIYFALRSSPASNPLAVACVAAHDQAIDFESTTTSITSSAACSQLCKLLAAKRALLCALCCTAGFSSQLVLYFWSEIL